MELHMLYLRIFRLASALVLFSFYIAKAEATQTNFGLITQIKATNSQAYIYVQGLDDPFGCGSSSFVRFYWTTSEADKLWAMILSAQMAGKNVSFEGTCVSGNLSANIVYIQN
jgi:hypothetical protein